jgi:hypothetical protein
MSNPASHTLSSLSVPFFAGICPPVTARQQKFPAGSILL